MFTVCPGEHRLGQADDEVSVVWWAPDELSLGAQASFGLRRDDLIVRDVSPTVLRKRLQDHEVWQAARAAALATGGVPSLVVMTVTEWVAAIGGEEPPSPVAGIDVTVETAASAGHRPAGPRFGTLVHALLAEVPLAGPDDGLIARLAEAYGRVLAAEPEEVAVAADTVRRVLSHPVMMGAVRAGSAGLCYRETPVTWRLATGAVVEGIVDLAYVTDEGVLVVDFKTDRELDGALDQYRRQVQIYAAAVGSALGRPARGVLMRV
jgi:hypothetical protein